MADYKDIAGTTVRGNAGVLTSAKTGELFYDSTNDNFSYRFPAVTTTGTWRTGGNLNTARSDLASTIASSPTSALIAGGGSPGAQTEKYDGISFTEVADLATARNGGGGPTASLGTASSAILAGGNASPYTTATEEWSAADFTINPVTTS